MNQTVPVAGVDVSKRFSDLCVLAPNNDILTRMKIYHDLPSMERALTELRRIKGAYGATPVVVMESTSHYHLILFQFFQEAGFEVIVVNPIQSDALKNINVRKVKNDKVDAYKIAMLYRLKVLRASQVPANSLRGLRLLCRQRSELMGDVTRYKNRLTAYLDQVFPGYDKVFSDVGGVSSRAVLKECATPQALLSKSEDELADLIHTASRCGMVFSCKKSAKLHNVAKEAVKFGISAPDTTAVIDTVLNVLEILLQNIRQIEQDIKTLVKQETYIQKNLILLQTILESDSTQPSPFSQRLETFRCFKNPSSWLLTLASTPASGSPANSADQKTKCPNEAHPKSVQHSIWLP